MCNDVWSRVHCAASRRYESSGESLVFSACHCDFLHLQRYQKNPFKYISLVFGTKLKYGQI